MAQVKTIRDPKPEVARIETLASRIKDGDILLPKFQRDFIWERQQVLDLFDSISKNYPIGSVLLWLSKNKLSSENSIAGLEIAERAPEYPVNYLLDGQQRLSSICGALYWDAADKNSLWNIVYDLKTESFAHLATTDDPPLHQVRLNKLTDATAFFKQVASLDNLTSSDKGILKERAEALFNRFKEYQVATVTLSDMPIDSVAPIFERINSTGTALTIVDLMRAATWSEDFDLIDTIDGEILEKLSDKGFDGIERKAVLRNLSAAAGGAFSADSIDSLRSKSAEDLKKAGAETLSAYQKATDFLVHEIGAPNSEILPYANQMVVLSELFRLMPSPNAKQYAEIKKWFWRTTFSGYFSGWNTGQMSSDLKLIRNFASEQASELEVITTRPDVSVWKNRQFRSNNAHAKMLGLMLSHNGALDLVTGQRLTLDKALAWSNEKEYHHIFPNAFLKSQGFDSRRINAIGNFALLSSKSNKSISDTKPSIYFKNCEAQHQESFEQVLEANIIPESAYEAAIEDNFDAFLEARAKALHSKAMELCSWSDASDPGT